MDYYSRIFNSNCCDWCYIDRLDHSKLGCKCILIFTTILTITGALDAMDDINAISQDAQPDEAELKAQKRFVDTQWGMFKGLIVAGFGFTAIASLYIMWIA